MMTPERLPALYRALQKRGFYNPYDVFNHSPELYPPADSRYDCMVSIVKWNTSSSQLVRLNARWDSKREKYVLSTYKTGSVARQKHGEKMR